MVLKKTSWTLGRPTLWSSSQELQEAVDDCYNLNGWALPKKDFSCCWFSLTIDLFGQLRRMLFVQNSYSCWNLEYHHTLLWAEISMKTGKAALWAFGTGIIRKFKVITLARHSMQWLPPACEGIWSCIFGSKEQLQVCLLGCECKAWVGCKVSLQLKAFVVLGCFGCFSLSCLNLCFRQSSVLEFSSFSLLDKIDNRSVAFGISRLGSRSRSINFSRCSNMNNWMPPMLAGLCRRSLQHKLTIRCTTQPVQVEFGL